MLAKMNRYTSYSAREKWEKGRRVTLPGALLRGWHTFNIDYFFRGGIRYGYRGFFIALSNASGTFYRYLKLYELQKMNARK